tara:strand:- start:3 stop:164 length:162 start_codon:yes stop_codon:yes gene_type:complete
MEKKATETPSGKIHGAYETSMDDLSEKYGKIVSENKNKNPDIIAIPIKRRADV